MGRGGKRLVGARFSCATLIRVRLDWTGLDGLESFVDGLFWDILD